MGSVYIRPSTSSSSNRGYQRPTSDASIGSIVVGVLRLAGVGLAIGAIIFLGLTLYTAAFSLTWPAVLKVLTTPSALSARTCGSLILEGCLAGLVIGVVRKRFGSRSKGREIVLSRALSFKVFLRDETVIPTLLLSVLVASAVAVVASACGTVGASDLFRGGAHMQALGVLSAASPIAAIAVAGGAGGIGGGGGVFGLGFFWIVMILIAFVVQGIIVGGLAGVTLGLLLGAVRGAARGGAVAAMASLIPLDAGTTGGRGVWKSTKVGALQGALVGGIVGLIQGIVTAIAFHPIR